MSLGNIDLEDFKSKMYTMVCARNPFVLHLGPAGAALPMCKPKAPKHITKLQGEMQLQMMKLVAEDIDVVEIYSPPRVTKRAEQ